LEPEPNQESDLILPNRFRLACVPVGVSKLWFDVRATHAGINPDATDGSIFHRVDVVVIAVLVPPELPPTVLIWKLLVLIEVRRTEGPDNKNGRQRRRSLRNRYFAKNGISSALPRTV